MVIPNLITNLLRRPSRPAGHQHAMLTGIYQTVFLNQWGVPEIKISLDRLQGVFELDALFLNSEPSEDDNHTVWIYEKRDMILFFKRGRLVSHFRWSEFKERWKAAKEETVSQPNKRSSSFTGTPLSLVA
jgi:hypothetical protein